MRKIFACLVVLWILPKLLSAQNDDNRIIKVPVVFHVLYSDSSSDNGINPNSINKGNSSEYIPTQKLLAELKDLHDDFLLLNADTSMVSPTFKKMIGNSRIEFVLADTILQRNGEKGIIRKKTDKNKCELYNQSKPINPLRYLNIYIGRLRTKCGIFGVATNGLANVPQDSLYHSDDGVNLNYQWVDLGYRLLTHEAGHWAGLYHVFNDGCSDEGDYISDTPPQSGSSDVDCVKCPSIGATNLSCDKNKPYNYNNYMDYSGCRKMFTIEQAKEMRKTIIEFRPQIWRYSN